MQTHTIELNYNNYSVPDTASIRASDFNVITHSIIKNVNERDVLKFGTFASDVNFAHDDSFQVVKGREMRGGIDTELACISNFHKNAKSLSRLRDAIERNSQLSLYEREAQYEWLKDTQHYFKTLLQERMTLRKRPTHYTGALKHKKTRRFMANAAFLIIENEDESLHLFARIGQTEYDFEFSMKEIDVKSGKQLRCDHSVYDASTIGKSDDFLLDEFEFSNERQSTQNKRCNITSTLEIKFEHRAGVVDDSFVSNELQAVLDSIDAEFLH
ncbi:hypothetical protein [Vibrio parahaemolyticus]|uniref:hypothetical protein n=1 Tax=Vibrio parahaemolyticus TaxID=670 RepID=UPI00111DE6D6|nr:hypothetical protein [Vibrio parahaemolyticus]ELA8362068.1 hypothetical protein [Vibrio alginolyticus]ELA8364573.1 hypothetical protein [Vibrio alginolyticus]KAB5598657.1 hypothetical protein F0578_15315 [Vibrio parahaemolyticus]TOK36677.1 hypothetical protein CGI19_09715 [Vibrio parahaemolyticus]TOK61394.1 hypothetical protein CGI16_02515 [Vibrio parahaemolyticus]